MSNAFKSLAAVLCVFLLATSLPAAMIFNVPLEASQEVDDMGNPSSSSTGTGHATLTLNDDESELAYELALFGFDFSGILTPDDVNDDITGVHIHEAPTGSNGAPVLGIHAPWHDSQRVIVLAEDQITITGVWDAADIAAGAADFSTKVEAMKANGLYFNVHTNEYPAGAIRGQFVPEPTAVTLLAVGLIGLVGSQRGRHRHV